MRIEQLRAYARRTQLVRKAAITAGVIIIFTVGYTAGQGRLRLISPGVGGDTGLSSTLNFRSVQSVYDALRQNYDGKLTDQQILDGIKHGIAQATGDPYTEYFTAAEAKEFNSDLQGQSLIGIGAQLDQDAQGNVVVMSPIEGSPASAAGIRAKDVIITIDGKSTAGMSVNDAVKKIRGTKGTNVTLGIVRGGKEQLTFTITRDTINVPTATSKVLDDNVGYIQVSQFAGATPGLVDAAAAKFKQAGVTKLVLDMRDNPGGEVTSAQDISSQWLRKGDMIMQEKRGDKNLDNYRATASNAFRGMPTVVLVNNGSASAAEITALALRDHKAATIIGEQSYGKGVVQQVMPLRDGGELKVTIAKWYSPNGINIHKKGITPDQVVTISDEDSKAGVDTQLNAALDYLKSK